MAYVILQSVQRGSKFENTLGENVYPTRKEALEEAALGPIEDAVPEFNYTAGVKYTDILDHSGALVGWAAQSEGFTLRTIVVPWED